MDHLPPVTRKFILHWGEMGTRWGINRTMAQIHALLFISENPLNAEEICDALGVARSNVSNSLRELQNWKIVKPKPISDSDVRMTDISVRSALMRVRWNDMPVRRADNSVEMRSELDFPVTASIGELARTAIEMRD